MTPRESTDGPAAAAPFLPTSTDDDAPEPKAATTPNAPSRNLRLRLLVTLFTMILTVEMGMAMAIGPITRISEAIACREYYAQHDPAKIGHAGQVSEDLCKVKAVQNELAAVKGYMEFFDGLLSAVLAIPYGLLADRHGRKRTLCLSIPGFALNSVVILAVLWFSDVFPLRAVWLSCLAWVLGGGPVVAFAIIWTMMADVTTDEERASIFFRFGVASMAADFISSAISSWLMTLDPWVPLLSGFAVVLLGVLFTVSLPETMHHDPTRSFAAEQPVEMSHLSPDEGESYKDPGNKEQEHDDSDTEEPGEPFLKPSSRPRSRIGAAYAQIKAYTTPYTFIFAHKQILLLLSAFLVYRLSRGSSWFLVQYISTRYHWTLAQANLLMSFRPVLTIPLFLFILPAVSRYLLRSMQSTQKDLRIARFSIIFLTLGTLGIGLSPSIPPLVISLVIQAAGSGFLFVTRSLITSLIRREQTAKLFTVIEILQSVGSVIASLVITNVFRLGIDLGGFWIGLAWFMTSSLFIMVGIAVWLVRIPGELVVSQDDAEERYFD